MREYAKDTRNGQTFYRGKIGDWRKGHADTFMTKAQAKNKQGHGHSISEPKSSHLANSKLEQLASLRRYMNELDRRIIRAKGKGQLDRAKAFEERLENAIAKFVLVSKGLNIR